MALDPSQLTLNPEPQIGPGVPIAHPPTSADASKSILTTARAKLVRMATSSPRNLQPIFLYPGGRSCGSLVLLTYLVKSAHPGLWKSTGVRLEMYAIEANRVGADSVPTARLRVVVYTDSHPAKHKTRWLVCKQSRLQLIPHPRSRGDWMLKPNRGAPYGLWYRDRAHAVSYAEWVAREVEQAETRVFNRDGTLAERRDEKPSLAKP